MAGRRVGYAQATLALIGFLLTLAYLVWVMISLVRFQMMEERDLSQFTAACAKYAWVGIAGVALSIVAWCWALVSSLQILSGAEPDPKRPR
jgi:nitrate/nitrite transporter NarK